MNSYLQQARELIEIATKGMSHDELAWHPAEGKWSTANILEHLMLAFWHGKRLEPCVASRGSASPSADLERSRQGRRGGECWIFSARPPRA